MNPTDFVSSLYGAIIGDTQAVGGVQAGSSSYVTLEWPGMPIDPAQYGNIWASDNQTGSPEAVERFSDLVDDNLPALSPLYQPTGIALEQVYKLILLASVPAGPLATTFAAAQETFDGVARGSLENPQATYHPTLPAPRTWCDPSGEAGWTAVSIGTANPTAPPPPPPPVYLRSVLAKPAQWQVATISRSTSPVLTKMATRETSSVTAAHVTAMAPVAASTTLAPGLAQSAALAPAATRSATMNLRPLVVAEALQPAPAVSSAVLTKLRTVAIKRPIETPPPIIVTPKPPLPVTGTQLGATFKYRRVSIQRQWLDGTVFRLPGWSIGGLAAGSISNGRSDSNPGLLPLLPVGFIAVKEVSIKGIWSDTDKAAVGSALSAGSVGSFGPFSLAGGGPGGATFDGSTLRLPGIQIVAWICEVTPRMPPV
jgi:hypothetical protein